MTAEHLATTSRLVLRTWREGDERDAHALWGDPEVMRFIPGGPHPDRNRTRLALDRANRAHEQTGCSLWAVELRDGGDFVGDCGFHRVGDDEVELAFHFRPERWGLGYATEAARACLELAFSELGARRVVAYAHRENAPSQRVLAKLGFRPTAADRAAAGANDGPTDDELCYELLGPRA